VGLSEKKLEEKRIEKQKERQEEIKEKEESFNSAELFIVSAWVYSKPFISLTDDVYPYLTSKTLATIFEFALDKAKSGQKVNPSALFTTVTGDISKIVDFQFRDGDGEAKYKNCLVKIKSNYLLEEKNRLAKEYNATKNPQLVLEMGKVERQLRELRYGGVDD
jgi:hypothetical protein